MDARTKKVWISIVVALVIIAGFVVLSVIGGAWYFIHRHVDAQFVSADTAAQEFTQTRARFAGQEPLIELRGEYQEVPVLHTRERSATVELQALRLLAFDAQAHKMVHVSIPFWILRLARDKPFRFSSGVDFDTEHLHLTVEDLERAGPGLVLDTRMRRNGGEVIMWTE